MGDLTLDEATHTYRHGNHRVPGVSEVLRAAGCMPSMDYVPQYALDRGRYVHRAIEWLVAGDLDEDDIDPQVRVRVDAYKAWRADLGSRLVVVATEAKLMSEAPFFAGTVDQLVMLDGRVTVVEIKCGPPEGFHALQGAAYQHLTRAVARHGLYLAADGRYKFPEWTDRRDWPMFASALALWTWRRDHHLLTD